MLQAMNAVAHCPLDRLEVVRVMSRLASTTFADDIAATLGGTPKRLVPPKYFYDDVGSALFDAITRLPAYYLARAETQILNKFKRDIIRAVGTPFELLELGSGSANKTHVLIGEALRTQGALRFSAIEISRDVLEESSLDLLEAFPSLLVTAYAGDYFDVLESGILRSIPRLKMLALCMGSHIGNYDPPDTQRLLSLLSGALHCGDALLVGTDLKKDALRLEHAYHDAGGVMEAFGKNLLIRMNRELGSNFDPSDFDFVVRYDEANSSVDSFLRSRRNQTVPIPACNRLIEFARGELILMERSRKFDLSDVQVLAARNSFTMKNSWYDPDRTFALHLLTRE
jgi:L-histidine Nalpha-methyltransferase